MNKKIQTVWFTRKREIIFLIAITILAFFLRFYLIPQNLFFGPEQGIDFLAIQSIVVGHKLTLIGAKTDIAGIFHGPLYYYIAAIPFVITRGNPIAVSAFLIFLQSLTVIPLYFLGKKMFSNHVGIIAVILFTFSFEAIASSRWLSGQPLAIPLTVLLLLFLYNYLQGKSKYLFYVAFCFGLVTQLEFLNLILFSAFLVVIFGIYYKRVIKTNFLILLESLVLAGIVAVGPFILFDIRHQFLIFHSIIGALSGKGGFHVSYLNSLQSTMQIYDMVFVRTIFPLVSTTWSSLILLYIVLLVWIARKAKDRMPYILLCVFIFLPAVVLFLLHQSVLEHFFMPALSFILLTTAVILERLIFKNVYVGWGLFVILVVCSWVAWVMYLPNNKNIFFQSTQPFLHYSDQIKTIDTIYQDTNHKQFAFQAYTIPYWSQEGWEYLFWYFGSTKYGYYPSAITHDKLYVIVQRDPGKYQDFWLKNVVSHWGTLEKKVTYGGIDLEVLQTASGK